ncbi:membrane protein [Mycobacterium phage Indlovu]|nr:membrane protein [Mycobacterium phage Indlovu]
MTPAQRAVIVVAVVIIGLTLIAVGGRLQGAW